MIKVGQKLTAEFTDDPVAYVETFVHSMYDDEGDETSDFADAYQVIMAKCEDPDQCIVVLAEEFRQATRTLRVEH